MRPLPRVPRPHPARPGNPHAPLSRLRRRFALGGAVAAAAFIGALFVAIFRDAPGDDAAMIGIEVGASAAAVLCATVATMTWIITEHVAYLASLWNMIENIRSAGDHLTLVAKDRQPGGQPEAANPIPIQRGRDMKRNREDRDAV